MCGPQWQSLEQWTVESSVSNYWSYISAGLTFVAKRFTVFFSLTWKFLETNQQNRFSQGILYTVVWKNIFLLKYWRADIISHQNVHQQSVILCRFFQIHCQVPPSMVSDSLHQLFPNLHGESLRIQRCSRKVGSEKWPDIFSKFRCWF